ncbi:transmembrane protein 181-like isoform X2 [Eriocheir sinensis]|uniref:transmembrane protein 181-like isoform X2 n=1 Tax=Eriocheir sinensis TaxID=95602 RepID=UPI0021C831F1|nr:transmembrane protein 181-like isoform X2 [Eriocheir sinensis]
MRPRVCRQEDRSYVNGFLREFGLSVQMRLYTMHKREFVMVFIVFFVTLGLALFIGLAGPPITVTQQQSATQLGRPLNHSQLLTGPYQMKCPPLSTYAQQLWLIARVIVDIKDDQSFSKEFHLSVSVEGLTRDQQQETVLPADKPHNKSRTLECDQRGCGAVTIMHLSYLRYTHYVVTVTFSGLAEVQQWHAFRDVVFYFKTYNPNFTKLEIWLRFIFLLLAFIVACWLAHSLRKYALYDWSIEQKWMSILLPLLLLYNDPVFPMTFLVESWVPALVDTVFQATFLCSLLLFWLCIYHGLRQNERAFSTFYLPKFALVGLLWLAVVVTAAVQKCNELHDPLYSAMLETHHFQKFKIFFFVTGSFYLLYLLYLIITAYSELRSMPYFDLRLKFVTLLLAVVVSVGTTITVLRFGVGVLEDNFVAQLSTHYESSAQFMAFYGLLNLYVFTMAYVYSPSERALMETHILKDNPAFSMVNDSDEDVIYGSDEDTRRPLNQRSNDNDESD